MNTSRRNNRFIHTLLLLLLIFSVTGAMLSCTRSEVRTGAAFFVAQNTVSGTAAEAPGETVTASVETAMAYGEPVIAASYTDDANEADTDTGLHAMHTVQVRLLALGRGNGEKRYHELCLAILFLFAAAAGCLFIQRRLCRDLSCLILRRRAVIIYIYSQDGEKA